MNIQIDGNAFTKIDKMTGISNVEIELLDYKFENNVLKGDVRIYGEYYSSDDSYEESNGLNNFENIIPYEMCFTKNKVNIDKIDLNNFEYYEVAGRGIEASFIIDVSYDDVNYDNFLEEEKMKITEQVDKMLESKLSFKEENVLEEVKRNTNDVKSTLKVVYYQENDDVANLCKKYKCDYHKILNDNQKYTSLGNHRIIISELNGHN